MDRRWGTWHIRLGNGFSALINRLADGHEVAETSFPLHCF